MQNALLICTSESNYHHNSSAANPNSPKALCTRSMTYIQEGEPLALDLPKRNASLYTSSHWYLDDDPNAPEPVSETPLPHTSINPAAAFETADEGYDGVPFPRPPREFTRPSFLPDSDDG